MEWWSALSRWFGDVWQATSHLGHRHPNFPAWIQGVGSLAAVLVAVALYIVQEIRRSKERRQDRALRISQEREARQVRTRQESRRARDKADAFRIQRVGILLAGWPLLVQTRNRMAYVLGNLGRSAKKPPSFTPAHEYYVDYTIGVPQDWQRMEDRLHLFGATVALPIHEMLAILRQFDRDIANLEHRSQPVPYRMYADFLLGAKDSADTALAVFEKSYLAIIGRKPRRSHLYARSATAVAGRQRARVARDQALSDAPVEEIPLDGPVSAESRP